MNDDAIRTTVLAALRAVAPEVEAATLRGDRPLREQVDIDSMDFLRFLVGVHEQLGVEIPESAYPEIATLDALVHYVARRRPT